MDVLAVLRECHISSPAAIMVRHAERFDIAGPEAYWTTGLTDRGIAQAGDFGASLSEHVDSCRLFYSPVKRCRQTAENISARLAESGRRVMSVQPEKLLGVSYIRIDVVDGFLEADKYGDNFLRAWFDGAVPPEIFKPLAETRDEHLEFIRSKLSSAPPERHLDIYVTHDWNLNMLREGVFNLRHEDAGWPNFLAGMLFSEDLGRLTARIQYRKRILSAAIPL